MILVPPAALMIGVFSCSRVPQVPTPSLRDHPPHAGEATCIPFPPPPPKVEEIPVRPSDRHLWLDGQWAWETRRWVWRPGGWTVPPEDSFWAPWKLDRQRNGALAMVPGHWHREAEAAYDAATLAACPDPPKERQVVLEDAPGEAEAHVGPILEFAADAPSSAPPKVILDATIPGDIDPQEAPRPLIGPPPGRD